jgi:hypothetical protein
VSSPLGRLPESGSKWYPTDMATVKHIAPPATARQILSTIRLTKKDRAVVNKVLADMGYTPDARRIEGEESVTRESAARTAKKVKVTSIEAKGKAATAAKTVRRAQPSKKAAPKSSPRKSK